MRVCDITREDEVVATVTLTLNPIDINQDSTVHEFEVGKRAFDAISQGAWGALQNLVPPALRVKDVKKQQAARKAAVSRAANAAQKGTAPAEEAPAAPKAAAGTAAPTTPAESASEQHSASEGSGDPGF